MTRITTTNHQAGRLLLSFALLLQMAASPDSFKPTPIRAVSRVDFQIQSLAAPELNATLSLHRHITSAYFRLTEFTRQQGELLVPFIPALISVGPKALGVAAASILLIPLMLSGGAKDGALWVSPWNGDWKLAWSDSLIDDLNQYHTAAQYVQTFLQSFNPEMRVGNVYGRERALVNRKRIQSRYRLYFHVDEETRTVILLHFKPATVTKSQGRMDRPFADYLDALATTLRSSERRSVAQTPPWAMADESHNLHVRVTKSWFDQDLNQLKAAGNEWAQAAQSWFSVADVPEELPSLSRYFSPDEEDLFWQACLDIGDLGADEWLKTQPVNPGDARFVRLHDFAHWWQGVYRNRIWARYRDLIAAYDLHSVDGPAREGLGHLLELSMGSRLESLVMQGLFNQGNSVLNTAAASGVGDCSLALQYLEEAAVQLQSVWPQDSDDLNRMREHWRTQALEDFATAFRNGFAAPEGPDLPHINDISQNILQSDLLTQALALAFSEWSKDRTIAAKTLTQWDATRTEIQRVWNECKEISKAAAPQMAMSEERSVHQQFEILWEQALSGKRIHFAEFPARLQYEAGLPFMVQKLEGRVKAQIQQWPASVEETVQSSAARAKEMEHLRSVVPSLAAEIDSAIQALNSSALTHILGLQNAEAEALQTQQREDISWNAWILEHVKEAMDRLVQRVDALRGDLTIMKFERDLLHPVTQKLPNTLWPDHAEPNPTTAAREGLAVPWKTIRSRIHQIRDAIHAVPVENAKVAVNSVMRDINVQRWNMLNYCTVWSMASNTKEHRDLALPFLNEVLSMYAAVRIADAHIGSLIQSFRMVTRSVRNERLIKGVSLEGASSLEYPTVLVTNMINAMDAYAASFEGTGLETTLGKEYRTMAAELRALAEDLETQSRYWYLLVPRYMEAILVWIFTEQTFSWVTAKPFINNLPALENLHAVLTTFGDYIGLTDRRFYSDLERYIENQRTLSKSAEQAA